MWVGFWKAEAKKVPYKHPWRDEKGSYRARKGADPGTSGRNYRDSASGTSAGWSRDSASPESSCHRFLGYSGFSEASSRRGGRNLSEASAALTVGSDLVYRSSCSRR